MAATSGMRLELIKKFRREINDKTYVVKSQEIASKMAKELFNSKSGGNPRLIKG